MMAPVPRTHLGTYEILDLLGAGGMGEVYRARDTRLDREVAIKILPVEFSHDPIKLARFRREAQVLASLNHPNIAAIHGLEEYEGIRFLVLELVPGETLAQILVAGRLSTTDAIEICCQITGALEEAHEKGVVHRDLKPANVMVTPEGKVKVLDFGLAKALEDEKSGGSPSHPSAPSNATTREGVLLGTAAYMSPEQARGKTLDKRTDIWSFGCVFYEVLTARRAFPGETDSDSIAAVLTREPNWKALPEETPAEISILLHRCLQKDANHRLQHIGDARIVIEETLATPGTSSSLAKAAAPVRLHTPAWKIILPWCMTALMTVIAGFVIWTYWHPKPSPPASPARFIVALPASAALADSQAPALSLDGRRLVFAANNGQVIQLYLRPIDQFQANPIPGTEGASGPFFSPDGQWVGFFAGGKLKKVSLSGGTPVTVCDAPGSRGASWGSDGMIIFPMSYDTSLYRVSAAGGVPQPFTSLDADDGESSHRWPETLPGGKGVIFTIANSGMRSFDDARIAVQSLHSRERQILLQGGTFAKYSPTGHLVFARGGTLLAVPFDLERLRVRGTPVPMIENVRMSPGNGSASFAFSALGSLIYVYGETESAHRNLVWVDRSGEGQTLPLSPRGYFRSRLSPDGKRLALQIDIGAARDIWLYDIPTRALNRLTFEGIYQYPVWSPDSQRLTFSAIRPGNQGIFWMPADGSAPPEQLASSRWTQIPSSWSPDGRTLAYSEINPSSRWDIWKLSLDGERKTRPFLQTQANEADAAFSPDGKWLAYVSNESGQDEVYVVPFGGQGNKRQISTDGGSQPLWSRDGTELCYRNGDKLLAVDVATKPVLKAGRPKLVFEGKYDASYDISLDGKRFLMIRGQDPAQATRQINLILGWFDELIARVP